jgi:predicted kinase
MAETLHPSEADPGGNALDLPVTVVAMVGLPGAGKTVVARHLCQVLGWRRVCRDLIRDAMFPDCRYTLLEKRAAQRAVWSATAVNVALRLSCVVDGMTLSRSSARARLRQASEQGGARYLQLWLKLPPRVARERVANDLAHGLHLARDRDPELVDRVFERFEEPTDEVVVLDAEMPPDALCAAALAVVRD